MSYRPSQGRDAWIGAVGVFVAGLILFGALFQSFPVLYDTDSYYHLAIARAYARHGIIDSLPWARLSLLHDFADKELAFHLLLAPFADTADATGGGRFALALLNALVCGLLAFFGMRAVGWWGLLAPLLAYAGSIDFLGRMIRLRPESLSLILLIAAVFCAGMRRYRWLGVLAAIYALSYTAFQAFFGLTFLWFAHQLWAYGRREWALLLYPLAGLGVGLVAHPHFPRNLVIWKVQNVDFFLQKELLNVGAEIGPHRAPDLIWTNLAWMVALVILWRSAELRTPRRADATSDFLWITAAVFGGLYILMMRFSVYFVPFTILAVLFELERRGARLTRATRLPWRGRHDAMGRIPLAVLMTAIVLAALPRAGNLLNNLSKAGGAVPREVEWRAFGAGLPPGARVAAEWGSTHIYMFWAPQASFLNVLDPVFMNVSHPDVYRSLRAVFEDREPDVPRVLTEVLDSEYLALSRFHRPASLLERLDADPRLRLRHDGYTLLYELTDGGADEFVVDWLEVPRGGRMPPAAGELESLLPYAGGARLPATAGYVAGSDATGCRAFVHRELVDEPSLRFYELAPYGPTRVWIDEMPVVSTRATLGARLDRSLTFSARLEPGPRRLSVLTCPGHDGGGPGFYLRRRVPPGERPGELDRKD